MATQGVAATGDFMAAETDSQAFPQLDDAELRAVEEVAECHTYRDGETVFCAGQPDIDWFVVKSGQLDILNPADGDSLVVSHMPGQFTGDIDLLTRRPVIVDAVARGPT